MRLGAKTLDQLSERAVAAPSESLVVVPSLLMMARLTALRSKGDQSLRSLLSWAALPPLGGGGALLVFGDLSLDLRVGDFRGAFVKQAGAGHDNNALGVNLDEFPDEGGAF